MMESEMFELHATPALEELWNQIGYDESQRTAAMDGLKGQILELCQKFEDDLTTQVSNLQVEISNLYEKYRKDMKAYGIPDESIDGKIGTIRPFNLTEQLEMARNTYSEFRVFVDERIAELDKLVADANGLFDCLGVPAESRGEFGAVGEEDLSQERVERFKAKIEELTREKEEKQSQFEDARADINLVLAELGEDLTGDDWVLMSSPSLSPETMQGLRELKEKLERTKQERIKQISDYALAITHLWNLLNIPENERTEFLEAHSTLGINDLEACKAEVRNLENKRDEILPEIVKTQRSEVEELWNTLHIPSEKRNTFVPDETESQGEQLFKEFEFMKQELEKLKALRAQVEPVLELVQQRENIISEYKKTLESSADPSRLMSRAKGCAQALIREEKARRRYKVSLPRLEKKLYQALCEYKQKTGEDFEWDGQPYVDSLSSEAKETKPILKRAKKKKQQVTQINSKTLPPSPRRVLFEHDANIDTTNNKDFSIRRRSPIKINV